MTSVTISDDLRQKLKRLAAKYDTTQAEIIRRSVETFEKYEKEQNIGIATKMQSLKSSLVDDDRRQKVEKMLVKATAEFEEKYPEIARRRKELAENPEIIEEVTIGNWDITFEE